MKRLLILTLFFVLIFMAPVTAQVENKGVKNILMAQLEKIIEIMPETINSYDRYTTTTIDIYKEPYLESEVIKQEVINTKLSIQFEANGWSVITTDSGLAYAKSEYLSENLVPTYTEEELYIMAHLLAGEVQGYSDEEQRYVGSVVLNRVKNARFPNTIKDVVFQKGQYSCTWDGNYNRTPTERNWANAKYLLEYGSVLPDNVVWQSKGKQGRGVYLRTSVHYYCY